MTREEVAQYRAQVIMAVCGLSHTNNTKVGNDFIRGVVGFRLLLSRYCPSSRETDLERSQEEKGNVSV
jgi:hypothetical protein